MAMETMSYPAIERPTTFIIDPSESEMDAMLAQVCWCVINRLPLRQVANLLDEIEIARAVPALEEFVMGLADIVR